MVTLIADSNVAQGTITHVVATCVVSIETTNTQLVRANDKIKPKPCQPLSSIFFNKLDL